MTIQIHDLCLSGLCLLVLVSVPQLDATVAITVGTLALTAPQVTSIIALKALAVGAVAKGNNYSDR